MGPPFGVRVIEGMFNDEHVGRLQANPGHLTAEGVNLTPVSE
jgi:hypothetical protein